MVIWNAIRDVVQTRYILMPVCVVVTVSMLFAFISSVPRLRTASVV
jgi:hypothetical protein